MNDPSRPAPRPTPSRPIEVEPTEVELAEVEPVEVEPVEVELAEVEPVEVEPVEVEPVEVEPVEEIRRRRGLRARFTNRQRTGLSRRQSWIIGLVSLLLVGAAIAAAVIVLRPVGTTAHATRTTAPANSAQLTDQPQAEAFLAGATASIAAVTTYDYRDLDGALSTGLGVTTGAYRDAFKASLEGELGGMARRDKLVQTFAVDRAAIGAVSDDGRQAKVLVFGVQTVTVDDGKGGTRMTPITLTATVVKNADVYRISDLVADANPGLPPGTEALSAAAEAAREQITDQLTLRRASFDADLNRARRYAVNPLQSVLAARAEATRTALVDGKYDLAGTVTSVGVESASGATVVLLVAASGTKVTDTGERSDIIDGRYEVTVVYFDGRWRTSIVAPVATA